MASRRKPLGSHSSHWWVIRSHWRALGRQWFLAISVAIMDAFGFRIYATICIAHAPIDYMYFPNEQMWNCALLIIMLDSWGIWWKGFEIGESNGCWNIGTKCLIRHDNYFWQTYVEWCEDVKVKAKKNHLPCLCRWESLFCHSHIGKQNHFKCVINCTSIIVSQ